MSLLLTGSPLVTGLPGPGASRCQVMGIVNVTPDSFSDGGRYLDHDAAVEHGLRLVAEGADLVDVGGESTRPGSVRVGEREELRRVLPVVRTLSQEGVAVSVDTTRSRVAETVVAAGAAMINDVSGGLADPAMLHVVAEAGVPVVLMHWRGHADVMDRLAQYDDVVAEVSSALRQRAEAAVAAGLAPDRIVLDPGLGFAKTSAHNWTLLRRLLELGSLGFPLLIGASRKRFLAECAEPPAQPAGRAETRDDATQAVTALVAAAGAWAVRVHAVRPASAAVRVALRLR